VPLKHRSALYHRILTQALLNIRAAATAGDAEQCFCESDHVHNVPDLIASESAQAEEYYWEVERASYLRQSRPEYAALFAALVPSVDADRDSR
jgi:hypothetical protein